MSSIENLLCKFKFNKKCTNRIGEKKIDKKEDMNFLKDTIDEFMASKKRALMLIGQRYYENENDINQQYFDSDITPYYDMKNKLSHPFVRKMTDQKVQYILGRQFSIKSQDKTLLREICNIFNDDFSRDVKNICKESINKGISFVQVYFQDNKIKFRKISSEEVIPVWVDSTKREILSLIRVYDKMVYKDEKKIVTTHIKWYKTSGVENYIYENKKIVEDYNNPHEPHFTFNGKGYNFDKIPFVYFKYNEEEIPLVKYVKGLVDDYDRLTSIDSDTILEQPNAIYVLTNYDGENLAEFRENLFNYRAVKVSDGGSIDIKTANINTQNVTEHLALTRRDIYELGRGVDTQNDSVNKASGVALKFLYADIDLDCNGIELEFKSSFRYLMNFIKIFFEFTNKCDTQNINGIEFVFNRRMIINENETILNCRNSKSIIDDETIIANHPWVTKSIL